MQASMPACPLLTMLVLLLLLVCICLLLLMPANSKG
jgi:hypothetical protein